MSAAPTPPSRPPEDGPTESGLVPLERRVLVLWRIRSAIVAAIVVVANALLVGAAGSWLAGVAVSGVLACVAVPMLWWWTALVWRAWQFRVDHEALHLRHGVVIRRESTIPLHRVQHIDLEAGPLERRLRLTTFVLRTASAASDSTVPGIDAGDAEDLRHRILALVGEGDAV